MQRTFQLIYEEVQKETKLLASLRYKNPQFDYTIMNSQDWHK